MVAAVLDSRVALDTVVTEWISSYEQSADEALLNLTNFLIRSCGCTQFVTDEDFGNEENLLETLQEILLRYKEVRAQAPLHKEQCQILLMHSHD